MKFFPLVVISSIFLSATTVQWNDVQEKQQSDLIGNGGQEKQLTDHIKVQYQDFEQKGDESKFEITVKDPHFFWVDRSVQPPEVLGQIDHKGTLKIWVDIPGNTAKSESEGVTRFILGRSVKPDNVRITGLSDSERPIDFSISGKITKSIEGDFSKIKDTIAKIRTGVFSKDDVLTVLENVKKASVDGSNVKITLAQPLREIALETAKINYQHTSGATPEEFTVNIKSVSENKNHVFLDPDKRDSTISGKISLPDWSKLSAFAQDPDWKTIPEGKSTWDLSSKSEIDTSTSKGNFSSVQGDNPALTFEIHNQTDLATDWVKLLIANAKKNPPKQERDGEDYESMQSIYKWIISPQTLPFLSLIPLQSVFDLNGSFEYANVPTYVAKKGALALSLLGKKQSGIKLSFNGQGGQADNGNLQLVLVGGRPLFNRLVAIYNTFSESIAPFISQEDVDIKPLTPELKDKLYKLLLSYTADPSVQDKELKFNVKYDHDVVTIGDKTLLQFWADMDALLNIQPRDEAVQDELIEDEVMDVR